MIDLQNRGSFHFDRVTPQLKKGAAASPLNCRVEIPANEPDNENTRVNPYFLLVWTLFSLNKKTNLSVCQKEHFTGLFEMRLFWIFKIIKKLQKEKAFPFRTP
jgi:hypothetical protein